MGVVIIDDGSVRDFVSDESRFTQSMDEQFAALDLNNDDVLSRAEIRTAFESIRLVEAHFGIDVATSVKQVTRLYDSFFDTFDGNDSGTVDRGEFRSEMKKIMVAIANGLGCSPIQTVLEDDSHRLLQKAVDLEASKTAARLTAVLID